MRTDLILLILTALTLIPVWIALFLWLRKTRGNHKLRIGIFKGLLGRAETYPNEAMGRQAVLLSDSPGAPKYKTLLTLSPSAAAPSVPDPSSEPQLDPLKAA